MKSMTVHKVLAHGKCIIEQKCLQFEKREAQKYLNKFYKKYIFAEHTVPTRGILAGCGSCE